MVSKKSALEFFVLWVDSKFIIIITIIKPERLENREWSNLVTQAIERCAWFTLFNSMVIL